MPSSSSSTPAGPRLQGGLGKVREIPLFVVVMTDLEGKKGVLGFPVLRRRETRGF